MLTQIVHGFFRASGIVMIYSLHHDFSRREVGGITSECLGHFWRAALGQFWKAPKHGNPIKLSFRQSTGEPSFQNSVFQLASEPFATLAYPRALRRPERFGDPRPASRSRFTQACSNGTGSSLLQSGKTVFLKSSTFEPTIILERTLRRAAIFNTWLKLQLPAVPEPESQESREN